MIDYLDGFQKHLAGILKQSLPKYFSWIPNSIATNGTNSADEKRVRNVREGAFLSVFGSMIEAFAKITGAGKSLSRGRKFIPENELANKNLPEITKDKYADIEFDPDPVTDQFLKSRAREEDALIEFNKYYDILFDANQTNVRPKDFDGIAGAAVDNAQILKNIDSVYGRLASTVDETTRIKGLDPDQLTNREVVKSLADELKNAGKYSVELPSGKTITSQDMDEAGLELAAILNNPRMQAADMKLLLDEFKEPITKGVGKLSKLGGKALNKSIEFYKKEFYNMDLEKARAYFITSEAGQAADISEAARLMEGTTAVSRAQDQVLDRLEYLMVEKKLANYQNGFREQHLKAFAKAADSNDAKLMKDTAESIIQDTTTKLEEIVPKVKKFRSTLQGIKDERPEFLNTFLLATEMTDGNIDSMFKLQNFVENKLGVFSKAFVDGKPEVPSILVRAKMSVIFNSVLSSLATPLKALAGNVGGIIGKPASVFSGAIIRGEGKVLRRAFHQYTAISDSFLKAHEHMKTVYRKASTNPVDVSYIMRDDLALKEVEELGVLKSYAEAADKNGESGASALLSIWEQQDALARHPWLRFGANSMTALDGFNRALYAAAEARGRAFDAIIEAGDDISEETLSKASNKIYSDFFDGNDMIKDSAVDFATREAALNLDSGLVRGLNTAIKRVPLLRSIFMFPKPQFIIALSDVITLLCPPRISQ